MLEKYVRKKYLRVGKGLDFLTIIKGFKAIKFTFKYRNDIF